VTNYGQAIQNGLKNMGITIEVLAEKMKVKHNYLNNVSQGKMVPDIAFAKKLEKELNIKLVEEYYNEESSGQSKKKNDEFTLGDIVNSE
jgi:uncharacterized protein (TIGR00270 family)